MKAVLVALSMLAAVAALTLAVPEAGATSSIDLHTCSGLTTANCSYLLCVGAEQNQYGYYHCEYPIYYPCQYCMPILEPTN